MKILFVNDKFLPEKTTVGSIIYNLTQSLKERGHEIFIFTTEAGINLSEIKKESFNGFTVYKTGRTPDRIFIRYYPILYSQRLNEIFSKLLNEIKPDIIHFHNVHQNLSFSLFKIAKRFGGKVFLTAHDVQLFHYGKLIEFINPKNLSRPEKFDYKVSWVRQLLRFKKRFIPFRRLIIRQYLKYIDKIFAVSGALRDALTQNGIKNIEVIYNGINVEEWVVGNKLVNDFKNKYNLNNKKIILFGGRLNELKGGAQIISAMEGIVEKINNAVLVILGNYEGYAESLSNKAEQKGLRNNVVFTGWLSGDELKAAFNSADVIVSPSICFDSFPTINLEAMVCKKPVVSACFGGAAEAVLDGETGYVVNPFNIKELADKIVYLLENQEIAKKSGEAGFERVKKEFGLDRMVNNYLSWYNKISQ